MSKSILQGDREVCFICGEPADYYEPLDEHHVFGGAFRKKSEHYGLKVYLHHNKCHIFGAQSVHANAKVNRGVQVKAQKAVMQRYGWTEDEFREVFGRNYL